MGAAITSNSAANNTAFRKGMGHIVGKFYNLYNPQDLLLRKDYKYTEHQRALRLLGLEKGLPKLENYIEQDVEIDKPPFHGANELIF